MEQTGYLLHDTDTIMGNLPAKNEGPLPKMLNCPEDGASVSLPLGFKSLVRPLVEDFSC